jgi:hypothetical protein
MVFTGRSRKSIVKLTWGGCGRKENRDDEELSTTSTISQTLYLATFYGGNDLHASLQRH